MFARSGVGLSLASSSTWCGHTVGPATLKAPPRRRGLPPSACRRRSSEGRPGGTSSCANLGRRVGANRRGWPVSFRDGPPDSPRLIRRYRGYADARRPRVSRPPSSTAGADVGPLPGRHHLADSEMTRQCSFAAHSGANPSSTVTTISSFDSLWYGDRPLEPSLLASAAPRIQFRHLDRRSRPTVSLGWQRRAARTRARRLEILALTARPLGTIRRPGIVR